MKPRDLLDRAAAMPDGHGVTVHFNTLQQARAYKRKIIAARGNAARAAMANWERASANPEWTGPLPPLETGYENIIVMNPDGAPASLWIGKPIEATFGITKIEETEG